MPSLEYSGDTLDVERADMHVYRPAEARFTHVDEEAIAQALVRRGAASA